MPPAIIILFLVLIAIALRQAIRMVIPIWVIMTIGALAALLFNQITLLHAYHAIERDVMFYLFGVFLISQAAEDSGYLAYVTDKIFYYTNTGRQALLLIVVGLGFSAAFLMNDTIAIVGTPIILHLCKSHKSLRKPLLFALAFAITIGSVMSPVGNPQNLLIAVKGQIHAPFIVFAQWLMIPTLINLVITYFVIFFIYKHVLDEPIEKSILPSINDVRTAMLAKISLVAMVILVISKMLMDIFSLTIHINFSLIALLAATPILFSNQRWMLIKRLDWGTLIFFASTFILVQSVWESGFFQANINHFHASLSQIPAIMAISTVLSQFISNVPLVALYLPYLMQHGAADSNLVALAAGSTIAGNLSILGAASNIIIIHNSESRGVKGFGFFEFIAIGLPLTLINLLVYSYFIAY